MIEMTNIIRPKLTFLDEEQKAKIHSESLKILSSTGVRIESGWARKLFAKATGTKTNRGDLIFLSSDLVEQALKIAPSSVDIYNRRGNFCFQLPSDTRYGIGMTALYYQNPETNKPLPFTRKHMETSVRLGNMLSSFEIVSTVGVLQDVPAKVADLFATLEMTTNTVKPLVVLASNETVFPAVLDLLEYLHGDLTSKPFIIPYVNPITPLVINQGTADKMLETLKRGLPIIYVSYGMAGATTPITPAGELTLLNAELLAGLTLSQLIKEGAPVILGSLPAFLDMRGGGNFYDPNSYLIDLACAEMMDYYHLPHCGTSGAGMGWDADLISSGHQWLNHLVSCMGKVGLVPAVGVILGSLVFSPNVIVYANEVIKQVRIFAGGHAFDNDTIAIDEIAEAGPGGNFLTSNLTLKLFRQAYFQSDIFPQLTMEEWEDRGCPQAADVLRGYTTELINDLTTPADHGDLMEQGEAFIDKLK